MQIHYNIRKVELFMLMRDNTYTLTNIHMKQYNIQVRTVWQQLVTVEYVKEHTDIHIQYKSVCTYT